MSPSAKHICKQAKMADEEVLIMKIKNHSRLIIYWSSRKNARKQILLETLLAVLIITPLGACKIKSWQTYRNNNTIKECCRRIETCCVLYSHPSCGVCSKQSPVKAITTLWLSPVLLGRGLRRQSPVQEISITQYISLLMFCFPILISYSVSTCLYL